MVTLVVLLAAPAWGQEGRRARPADTEEDPPETGEAAEAAPEPDAASTRVACLEDASEDGYQRKGVQKRD